MRDDELQQLLRGSLHRHADDLDAESWLGDDLGPALAERGRRVRRRRRTAAVTGAGTTLALAVAVAVAVPRLGGTPGPLLPGRTDPPASSPTAGPTDQRLQRGTPVPAPTTSQDASPTPSPRRTRHEPRPTRTVTVTPTPTASASPSASATGPASVPPSARPSSTPTGPRPHVPAQEGATQGGCQGLTFPTPYGLVAYPAGMCYLLKGQQVGDRYLALVAANDDLSDSAPPNQGQLLSIGPDRKPYVIDQATSNGQIGSFVVSPDRRSVADDRTEFGSDEEQVNVWPLADPEHWTARYDVPKEWRGTVTDWTADGVVLTGQQSPSTLVWQPTSGRVVVRATPSDTPTVLRPGS